MPNATAAAGRAAMARGNHWCAAIHLKEDNARFILLILFLLIYMLLGAIMFSQIEYKMEIQERQEYKNTYDKFLDANPGINRTELDKLLEVHAEASLKGLLPTKRPRWDFSGAFYFVGTVVSTIGGCSFCFIV